MRTYNLLLALSETCPCSSQAVRSTFQNQGYEVTAAATHSAAVEALQNKDCHLVITDSLEVLKRAKELCSYPMAVVVTGDQKVTSVIRALRFGADDYFLAPLDPFELKELPVYCSKTLERRRFSTRLKYSGERTDAEIMNMLGIATHDIKGSLLSIAATLKLLSRGYYGRVDEGVANSLRAALSKTLGLIGMTEEYLCRTLLWDDALEGEGEALDLKQNLITPVLQELSAELKGHPVALDCRPGPVSHAGFSVRASRIGLKAVLRNLIRNAAEYGGKGCTISLTLEDRGDSYQLSVHNSGEPIPVEYRKKLFSKFSQLGGRDKGRVRTHGMGLGLYLTKRIIEKHGGRIWYEASEAGSDFIFTLPSGLTRSERPMLPAKQLQPHLASAGI